jgi:hypothetical protein
LAVPAKSKAGPPFLFGEIPRTPFWQARFYDFNVWTSKKHVEKLRCMHRNPVKRGLVGSPEEWRWGSCRFYFLDEPGPVRVNEGWGRPRLRLGWRESLLMQASSCPTLSQKARKSLP